jgi:hypothetical protein
MASKTNDLEQVLRQNLRLRRELGAAAAEAEPEAASTEDEIAKLRLELKLRLAKDSVAPKRNAELQRDEQRSGSKEPEKRWLSVVSTAWGILGLVCLGLATTLATLWLISG